jgi:hypothetical protein
MKVIYIAGWGRSGSTIFSNILNEIESCVHIGELCYVWENSFLNRFSCGCGASVLECSFWSEVFQSVFGTFDPTAQARQMIELRRTTPSNREILLQRVQPIDDNRFAAYRNTIEDLYSAVIAVADKPVIIDSSKNPYHLYLLSTIPSIELCVAHLVRDPRATAYSWMRKRIREDAGANSTVHMETFSPFENSRKWTICNLTIAAMRQQFSAYHRVRYEDFTLHPESTIARIADAFEIPLPVNPVSERTVHLSGNHTVWGNPTRTLSGPVKILSDSQWQSEMSLRDRFKASFYSWPLMKAYGY